MSGQYTVPNSVVVVGASHAAVQLADALRSSGYEGSLRLVGDERHEPYQRPALSKAFLKGEASAESLVLRGSDWYRQNSIDLSLGEAVCRIDRHSDGTGVVHTTGPTASGTHAYEFDRLVLATGARPRRLDLPGIEADGVIELRSIADAVELAERALGGNVVVIGGGFIGLEAAATICGLGGTVTVLEAGARLMGRAVGEATARFMLDAHRRMGIEVLLATGPRRILSDDQGRVRGVEIDGRVIEATTVLVGVGVVPRVELAESLGLSCAGGVVVDSRCVTSDGTTLAIGDCTVQPWPGAASETSRSIRLESVDNAAEQAVVASRTLLGQEDYTRTRPWFWSDQGEWKIQMVGIVGDHDAVVTRVDPGRPTRLVVGYFREDQLMAAECVNSPADFLVLRGALNRGAQVTPELFAETSTPLKRLLAREMA